MWVCLCLEDSALCKLILQRQIYCKELVISKILNWRIHGIILTEITFSVMEFNISEISPNGSWALQQREGSVNRGAMDTKNTFIRQNGLGHVIRDSVILIFDTYWTERNTSGCKLAFPVLCFPQPGLGPFLDCTSKRIRFPHHKH